MTVVIRPLVESDRQAFAEHHGRHAAESGRDDPHFMPYDPDEPTGPTGPDPAALELDVDQPGWQRWFIALDDAGEQVIGHVDLQGKGLSTSLHRCELGIGIEGAWRGRGLGRQLMQVGIDFAREQPTLDWLDLRVFAHNIPAQALYRAMGFVETGRRTDLFRIGETSIDDIMMSLDVSTAPAGAGDGSSATRHCHIRAYGEADEEQVIDLWRACGLVVPQNNPARDIARKLQVDRELFLVACDASGVLGTVMGGYEGHRGWINYLAVDPGSQHKGYGRLLMTAIEQRLGDRGCPKINLQVRRSNTAVIAFYESIGYRLDDVAGLGKRLQQDQQ